MKKAILLLTFLQLNLTSSAQTIISNQISWFSGIYERIDFYDEEGSTLILFAIRCSR